MYIKPSTIIPPNVKIHKLPPSKFKGKGLYTLLKLDEQKLENMCAARVTHGTAIAAPLTGPSKQAAQTSETAT